MRSLIRLFVFSNLLILTVFCQSEPQENMTDSLETISQKNQLRPVFEQFVALENDTIIDSYLYGKSDADSIRISQVIETYQGCLVLYITNNSCFKCLEQQLKILQNFRDSGLLDHLNIVSTFVKYRSIYTMLKRDNLEIPIYRTRGNNIGFDISEHFGPTYFITDNSRIMSMVFHVLQLDNEYITTYLDQILRRFFIHKG